MCPIFKVVTSEYQAHQTLRLLLWKSLFDFPPSLPACNKPTSFPYLEASRYELDPTFACIMRGSLVVSVCSFWNSEQWNALRLKAFMPDGFLAKEIRKNAKRIKCHVFLLSQADWADRGWASDRHRPVGAGWHFYHSLLAAPATPQLFLQDSAEKANLSD